TTLGTGTLSSGQATFTTSSISVSTHSITAVYGGDANLNGSTSSALSQTVSKANTTTSAVSSSANPSVSAQAVIFKATVSVVTPGAGTLTGTITFKDGDTTLGSMPVNGS